jgi:hypothetical protein
MKGPRTEGEEGIQVGSGREVDGGPLERCSVGVDSKDLVLEGDGEGQGQNHQRKEVWEQEREGRKEAGGKKHIRAAASWASWC